MKIIGFFYKKVKSDFLEIDIYPIYTHFENNKHV